jgi:hypothetical protein
MEIQTTAGRHFKYKSVIRCKTTSTVSGYVAAIRKYCIYLHYHPDSEESSARLTTYSLRTFLIVSNLTMQNHHEPQPYTDGTLPATFIHH